MHKRHFAGYIFVVTCNANRVTKAAISEKMPHDKYDLSSVWKEVFVIDFVPASVIIPRIATNRIKCDLIKPTIRGIELAKQQWSFTI